MAKVIPIGQPANESERQAIGFLRDHLPEGWVIFHNFEMRQGQEVFEIDIAILAPHAVYLVDVKGTRGNIDVYGSKWYPQGRQPFHSPLAKLRHHAKIMAASSVIAIPDRSSCARLISMPLCCSPPMTPPCSIRRASTART
ncbi:nuclease-related domain-containing protein [Burkholderia gladioli]|uniref:nuclease-related domain-containing protein n=1 Tax=Burkholderia gladioli TaxID=28095 RepID=UPI002B245CE4|nr:nuclease-related domain-containing protein [Burkholderia gladioli]MEB2548800.1 nuclease-related domain-containing protein [Burkholderia gladioli]